MAVLPDFSAATFVPGAEIDNAYLPLLRNSILNHRSETVEDGEVSVERNDFFTTGETHLVRGVETTVVHDTVYENEILLEDTLDFHAQDTDGNVWYFGEIVINYEYDDEGDFVGTNAEGAWLGDDLGSEPGIVMLGSPAFGPAYFEEFAPGVALDEAIVAGLGLGVKTGFGAFEDVLKTINTSSLFPDGAEFKFYAPGVGVILEKDVEPDGEIGGTSEIYRRSTVGQVDPDDGDDITLALGALSEGKQVADPGEVRDLDTADFAGDGSKKIVTVLGGTTGLVDALGAYLVDAATGEIGSARILAADLSDVSAGHAIDVDVPQGKTLGLFVVARVDAIGVDLSDYTVGGLDLRNMLTGGAANIADGIAPIVTDAAGNILPIQPLGALGADDGTNYLNPAAGLQALGLTSKALAGREAILLGFEDTLATSPGHDGDFNDVVVAVSADPLPDATLGRLVAEARSVWLGTAGDDEIVGTARADTIRGLAGDDEIESGGGGDRVTGGRGDDSLDGEGGDDRLAGCAGEDELDGAAGDDVLRGGRGDDELEGGAGADEFQFKVAGFGADTIDDFTRSDGDMVALLGSAFGFGDLDSNGDGRLTAADDAVDTGHGGLALDLGSGDLIAFDGVRALLAADFLFA